MYCARSGTNDTHLKIKFNNTFSFCISNKAFLMLKGILQICFLYTTDLNDEQISHIKYHAALL
jgi:hypothetical protein